MRICARKVIHAMVERAWAHSSNVTRACAWSLSATHRKAVCTSRSSASILVPHGATQPAGSVKVSILATSWTVDRLNVTVDSASIQTEAEARLLFYRRIVFLSHLFRFAHSLP